MNKAMKIVICGSMTSSREMLEIGNRLREFNHEVVLPDFTEEYAKLSSQGEMHKESAKNKIEHDLIRGYFEEIKKSDAILVCNFDKNGVKNYIGGNTFLEMGFAHVLRKKIFLLNPIPESSYRDELVAMQPVILDGDLEKIK
jgi:predicted RNA-binding protein with PUA domain